MVLNKGNLKSKLINLVQNKTERDLDLTETKKSVTKLFSLEEIFNICTKQNKSKNNSINEGIEL